MSETIVAVLNGAVQALAFALVARMAGERYRIWLHAGMLVVAAGLYVVFAARGGSAVGVAVELVGVAGFGGLAVLGLARRAPGLLALGWALHPAWDAALHTAGSFEAYTPDGWVAACFGFDLVLAALIARGWAGAPARLRPVPA
ncbi:MAG TPA: DUF6010 family protein [Longimicrobiaceae bacterium]|nr:DUF6010 family protein [Longimicrobiaceae bacterium]